MGVEIERKYLVEIDKFIKPDEGQIIKQAFLNSEKERVVRVRISGSDAFLTIKGISRGMSRNEYEYSIPLRDAEELIEDLCEKPVIEKTRYRLEYKNHIWDIDIFAGDNDGLVMAEIELQSEGEEFELPEWVGEEVTKDERYYNSNLTRKPYKKWE